MSSISMNPRVIRRRGAQLLVVLLCALALKIYYSTASPDQLRWILAPTSFLVELVSGRSFQFESHAGYLSSDHTFLIAASCAGVNFLITSFLMLSLRKLWRARSQNSSENIAWRFIPLAAVFSYLTTLVANTVRISVALRMQRMPVEFGWMSANQLHRFEGIFVYFGFLVLLFAVSERGTAANYSGVLRKSLFPLFIYYGATLGIPLATSLYNGGTGATDFWEHSLFVLLTPLLLIVPLACFHFLITQRSRGQVGSDERERWRPAILGS